MSPEPATAAAAWRAADEVHGVPAPDTDGATRAGGVDDRSAIPAATCIALRALGTLALRALLSHASGASLHVDEAQYWDWSRSLQWGYYSKPPVIAAMIAASRTLFGDSETGLRLLCIATYPLTAVVLWSLGRAMSPPGTEGHRLGLAAAAIFVASPLAAALGLVATTDGPLMLAWALALRFLWQAVCVDGPGRTAWSWAGFAWAVGAGLLDKYTMAALLPGAALFVWRAGGEWRRFAVACLGAALIALPNVAWNAAEGWPTLRHTLDITVGSAPREAAAAWGWHRARQQAAQALAFMAAQPLMLAPLVLPSLLALALRAPKPAPRRARPHDDRSAGTSGVLAPSAGALLLWTSLPLSLIGIAQSATGAAQVNWILPVHLAGSLALAAAWARFASRPLGPMERRIVPLALGAQIVACSLWVLPLHPSPRLDPLARMRGWEEALGALAPHVRAEQAAAVIGTTRATMAQSAYHWRNLDVPRLAWRAGAWAGHHYEHLCPLDTATAREAGRATVRRPVFVLSEGLPPPELALALGGLQLVAHASPAAHGGRAPEHLLLLRGAAALPAGTRTCR